MTIVTEPDEHRPYEATRRGPTLPVWLRLRRSRPILAAAVLLLGIAGCGDAEASGESSPTSTSSVATAERGPTSVSETDPTRSASETTPTAPVPKLAGIGTYAVGSEEVDVVDESRTTAAQGDQDELPERTLATLVLYPAVGDADTTEVIPGAAPEAGPWPLVVFSHGLGGTGPAYVNTLKLWASAGYVVVAPTYPLTSALTPDGPKADDLVNQPTDVSYLIDWATARPDDDPLAGVIDLERIGLAGHSLGGFTSLATAYNPKLRDERVDAVAGWAGKYPEGPAGDGGPVEDGPPLLVIHGDADGTVGYSAALATISAIGPPWRLITLVGGEHIPPYIQGLDDPYSRVVTEATLDFFDATLKDDPDGNQRLEDVIDQAGDKATLAVEEG